MGESKGGSVIGGGSVGEVCVGGELDAIVFVRGSVSVCSESMCSSILKRSGANFHRKSWAGVRVRICCCSTVDHFRTISCHLPGTNFPD